MQVPDSALNFAPQSRAAAAFPPPPPRRPPPRTRSASLSEKAECSPARTGET